MSFRASREFKPGEPLAYSCDQPIATTASHTANLDQPAAAADNAESRWALHRFVGNSCSESLLGPPGNEGKVEMAREDLDDTRSQFEQDRQLSLRSAVRPHGS